MIDCFKIEKNVINQWKISILIIENYSFEEKIMTEVTTYLKISNFFSSNLFSFHFSKKPQTSVVFVYVFFEVHSQNGKNNRKSGLSCRAEGTNL